MGLDGNPALRARLDDSGMTNGELARAVVRAAAAEGVHLATSATSVRRMLQGTQPYAPVPRLVAKVLARRLGYEVTVADCGFTPRGDPEDTFNGFRISPTVDGTIATVAELSRRDLNRRNFMLGSAFAASAFAEPAWLVTNARPTPDLARAGGSRVGKHEVDVLRSTVRHYESLHRLHGGGLVRGQVVQLLHQQARAMSEVGYTDAVGRELAGALAETAFLAGLTTIDSGRAALGQRYYAQALGLATRAGDSSFAANVLAEMSRVTIDIGMNAPDADAVEQGGQHAAALARSALQMMGGRATPAVGAYIHAIEARGLGLLGDGQGAIEALDRARRSFDRGPQNEPGWLGHYTEVDLTSDIGQCLRDAGRPRQGLVMLERALAALPANRVTSRAKTQIHIAAAHLQLRDFDAADHAIATALNAVDSLSSQRTLERVKALRRRARQVGAHQVDERVTAFLST
ncbi:hypothetical protein [Actinokineospora sp. NBRC 105648]|uniref:hypothetical protein n=1 Tax=Actinokineospora sp. NBRC 105648 TaxID=3032206 RepID=UPI0024A2710F|nr:hypothetical protein [Actinokineospora sp. NBRC 105648]GLZ37832.1 transcriptional regulator [Actinokineospora sp. NBRC 105648]